MTALATTSTLDSLLGAYRSHVRDRDLPEPTAVHFSLNSATQPIAVQPGGGLDTVRHLADLLQWATTIGDATACWRHTTDDRLHLSVTGRTTSGVPIKVYGGCQFDRLHGLVPLALGERATVSLDQVHTLVRSLRETHTGTGDLTTQPVT